MPDTIGFALATAFLASVFTIFGVIDRFVAGVAAEIRGSIAPAMVSGIRAWGSDRGPSVPSPRAAGRDAAGGTGGPGGSEAEAAPAGRRAAALVVPVGPVSPRQWHLFGRALRALASSRRPAGLMRRG